MEINIRMFSNSLNNGRLTCKNTNYLWAALSVGELGPVKVAIHLKNPVSTQHTGRCDIFLTYLKLTRVSSLN